mmetsp:Transcript_163558/g.298347  ORF Transcript_163558/g.298347 Transcript_163558/m.298347 type:complete len:249 (-) Transcript_163558:125-871(-)
MPSSSTLLQVCGAAALSLAALELVKRWRKRRAAAQRQVVVLPKWLEWIADGPTTYRVMMREWEDSAWRKKQGWQGWDLIHGPQSAVYIPIYYLNTAEKVLRGPVTFNPTSESHRGFCHGGAMTSAMDDVLGHICFMAVGQGPWTGATVQCNVKMMKPVRIGQTLLLEGKVTNVEQKKDKMKVSIEASLSDETGSKYAEMSGMSIAGAKIQPVQTEIDTRTWSFDETRKIMFDSAWSTPEEVPGSLMGA